MKNILFCILLILFVLQPISFCNAQSSQDVDPNEISTLIDSIAKKYKLPGLSIGIVFKDSIIYNHQYGVSNLDKKTPINMNTKFRVGSITKSFLALGFLKLVEEGKIDLDTPISSLIPEISIDNSWKATNPIKIVHLLEHTAGFDDVHFSDLSITDISDMPLITAIGEQNKSMKVRWKPGSRYSYSSVGYTIAGYILEKISGEKYEDYLQQQILYPIGMKESSCYFPKSLIDIPATGYEGTKELPNVYMNSRPAGSMISTVPDFSKFLQFMLNYGMYDGELIFERSSIKRMETSFSSTVAKEGLKIGYGLALPSYYRNGFLWYGHSGGGPGCLAKYAYCRELDIAYIFMMNAFDMEAEKEIRNAIVDCLTKNQQPSIKPSIKVTSETINHYQGYYEPSNPRLEIYAWLSIIFDGINIEVENDTLVSKSFLGIKTQLLPTTKNLFRESNEPDASAIFITTDDDGAIFQKGNTYYVKTAKWKPWLYRIMFVVAIIFMISVIFVAVIWIPIYTLRRYLLKKTVSGNLKLILFPLLAITTVCLGVSVIGDQTIVELTQMTNANIIFCISTYLFTFFSLLGMYMLIKNQRKSIGKTLLIYSVCINLSFVGFSIFLAYWGFIGLRLWAF